VGKSEGITATPSAVNMAIGKIFFAVIASACVHYGARWSTVTVFNALKGAQVQ
jgi:hypothetical protein